MSDITKIQEYYKTVKADFKELKAQYPFSEYTILPTVEPQPITMKIIAADKNLIESSGACEVDFLGEYSKLLEVLVPFDYKTSGCKVFGGRWIDTEIIPESHHHFNGKNKDGSYLLCVGVPESFPNLKNVVLENVRTADRMLVAYELFQRGITDCVEILEYSHGEKGRKEYKNESKKYRTK